MSFLRSLSLAAAAALGACAAAVITLAYTHADEPARKPNDAPGHAGPHGHGNHRFSDPAEWAARWDAPEREAWQKPDVVLGLARARAGARIADIGAGTGYFTRRIAQKVGPQGKAIAVDIEAAMLAHILERAKAEGLSQVEARQVATDDPGLAPSSVDAIVCINTWHHLDDRVDYARKLALGLVAGGRFVLVDWREGELPHGPPPEEKIPRARMIEEITAGGFKLVEESDALPYQYAIAFEPVR